MAKKTWGTGLKPKSADAPVAPPLTKEHEDLCNHCGKCCYKKLIIGRRTYITPFPCDYLDTATNLCTIYETRREVYPECLSIEVGLTQSAFPEDCPYVPVLAPPNYKPARAKTTTGAKTGKTSRPSPTKWKPTRRRARNSAPAAQTRRRCTRKRMQKFWARRRRWRSWCEGKAGEKIVPFVPSAPTARKSKAQAAVRSADKAWVTKPRLNVKPYRGDTGRAWR